MVLQDQTWNPFLVHFLVGLFDDTAGDTGTPTAQRRGLVGIIVTSGMDHQRTIPDIRHLEPRRRYRGCGCAIIAYAERREVAEMSHSFKAFMLSGTVRIIMSSCCKTGDNLAVLCTCGAVGVLVNMETVEPRGQTGELRSEDQSFRSFGYRNGPDILADPLCVDHIHRNCRVGGKCRGRCDKSRNDRG